MSLETRLHAVEEHTKLLNSKIDNFDVSALIDILHPVGEYYETSNENFDPNIVWGGTWELEPEGFVHISGSGSGAYKVDGTTYGANTKRIEDANIAHGHGSAYTGGSINTGSDATRDATDGPSNNATGSGGAADFYLRRGSGSGYDSGAGGTKVTVTKNAGASWTNQWAHAASTQKIDKYSIEAHTHTLNSHTHGMAHRHKVTIPNLGTPTNRTNFNVMQASKAVYRWHRTA